MIPGDNDVGGEGIDVKQPWKVNRFKKYLDVSSSGDVASVKSIDFFKVLLVSIAVLMVYLLFLHSNLAKCRVIRRILSS